MPSAHGVSKEDFLAYAQIKAYDVISSGNFKRHLSTSRENGDKWAIQMYNSQTVVQNKIRELFSLVAQLTAQQGGRVQKICKDVMSCAQPPVKVLTGYNVCSLTAVSAEHCIDLTRPGKNTREVYVHPRFRHFFMLLWYCAKAEYIIRACTKQWVEARDDPPHCGDYTQVCEDYFIENQPTIERLYQLFTKGIEYVTTSLEVFRDSCALQPALNPPAEYLFQTDTMDGNDHEKKEGTIQAKERPEEQGADEQRDGPMLQS